ncbi:hypothetical protein FRX31_012802 [Thalictrum thalictroides]|uniref:F-box/LRR-repeat protein n=1 Tax=Thalictrum thalictroides TaxID=46969 RepID=A0A7J6WJT0_THATH|nr:hypothetical protein FRX31_012802 [Thalictrum thalictroides]
MERFQGLRNVEKLTLTDFYIENLTRDRELSTSLATSCYTLKTLELDLYATRNQVLATTLLLTSYPNLETLNIFFSEEDCTSLNMLNMEEYWQLKYASSVEQLYGSFGRNGSATHLDLKELKCCKSGHQGPLMRLLYFTKFLLCNQTPLESFCI